MFADNCQATQKAYFLLVGATAGRGGLLAEVVLGFLSSSSSELDSSSESLGGSMPAVAGCMASTVLRLVRKLAVCRRVSGEWLCSPGLLSLVLLLPGPFQHRCPHHCRLGGAYQHLSFDLSHHAKCLNRGDELTTATHRTYPWKPAPQHQSLHLLHYHLVLHHDLCRARPLAFRVLLP